MTAFEHIITVDGPSGSGKTALLRSLAARLGCPALELGPIVRTVAWLAERNQVPVADAVAMLVRLEATGRLRIDSPGVAHLAASEVELNGRPLRQQVFSGHLSHAIVTASLDLAVMSWIHSLVRNNLRDRHAVLSAREGASRVCPTAGTRVRLEADPSVREARKRRQLIRAGVRPTWVDDAQLLGPSGSVHAIIDTTRLSIEEVSDLVVALVQQRLGWLPEPFAQPYVAPQLPLLVAQLRRRSVRRSSGRVSLICRECCVCGAR